MKIKISLSLIAAIILAVVILVIFQQTNYKTLNEAIQESNIPVDVVYYTTEHKGHTVIFYGKDETLSVGLMEKTFFYGYRWVIGVGSKHFNEDEQIITRSFNNLHPDKWDSDDDLISLTYGVINDESINRLMIKYKDSDYNQAKWIETPQGRIWFCFSDSPINYDPEVKRIYEDGYEASGWG